MYSTGKINYEEMYNTGKINTLAKKCKSMKMKISPIENFKLPRLPKIIERKV